jgi:TetR/AcrR family transcriptional regulator, transcriptional repressor for nem operon
MSATTKERILQAAESIMLEKSFHSVGLNEILKAVKVPKGSFYHYFASKEQFGVELLRHYCTESTNFKKQVLLSASVEPNPVARLFTYLEGTILKMTQCDGRCPCLVVKLASEIADFSEPMREVLAKATDDWLGIYAALISNAIERGVVSRSLEPIATAALIHDLWDGAMLRAATCRCVTPLRQATSALRNLLTKA